MFDVVHAVVCKVIADVAFKAIKTSYRRLKAKEKSGTTKNQTR